MKTLARTFFALLVSGLAALAADTNPGFYQRGAVYVDWYGALYDGSPFANQLSVRVRFDLISRPGTGWTLTLDARDRVRFPGELQNQALLYNVRLSYDKPGVPFYLSVGQMNLYDSAGIGQLLGGIAGIKVGRGFVLGGYGGLESGINVDRLETSRIKFGGFARWTGSRGKSAALSYNRILSGGITERSFAYANMFLPATRWLVLYGDAEYELGSHVAAADRLSRLFLNARFDIAPWVDIVGTYSSGRGLDFRQYLIEASQDPVLNDGTIERFYYTGYYGARVSFKPLKNTRVFVSRQESEQKDLGIANHSWRFGGSAWNLFGQGLGITADYTANRGQSAESDGFAVSLTKDFARLSLNANFSNVFNAIRISGDPDFSEIVHLDDTENFGLGALVRIGRGLSISAEYNFLLRRSTNEHFFFLRLIYRSR